MKLEINKNRRYWWASSVAILLGGLLAMGISWATIGTPLRPGLDFVGGTRVQLELDCTVPNNCTQPNSNEPKAIDPAAVRQILDQKDLTGSIQVTGENRQGVLIQTTSLSPEERLELQGLLEQELGTFDTERSQIDSVGPTLGRQLFISGMLALIISFVGIIVYLTFRFQFDYAFFAIVALVHDVLLTVGVFAILGLTLGTEVDSLFIVALLTIIGFSVNDTVVIYDRVREVIQQNPTKHIAEVVDDAVNQTLTRSINTSLTTILPLVAIFWFGGSTLKYFSLALIIGFLTGVYSSIFIASSMLAWWRERTGRTTLQPVVATEGPAEETTAEES